MAINEKDWELIEADFRSGLKTLRQIASEHEISHQAIGKRAKRDGWTRDLQAKIKAKAEALVAKGAVDTSVAKIDEKAVIEANAALVAGIQISHRQDIPRKRELVAKLFAEIEAQTDGGDLIEELIEALRSGDQVLQAGVVRKLTSLPQRIKGVAELVSAYKSLIGLEREAFGLNESGVSDPTAPDSITISFRRGPGEGNMGVVLAGKIER